MISSVRHGTMRAPFVFLFCLCLAVLPPSFGQKDGKQRAVRGFFTVVDARTDCDAAKPSNGGQLTTGSVLALCSENVILRKTLPALCRLKMIFFSSLLRPRTI